MQKISSAVPPDFMEPGSRGRMAIAVNLFLAGFGEAAGDDGFQADEVYGGIAAGRMHKYQSIAELDTDGGVGPATREQLAKDKFDFVATAQLLGGTTVFVQPGGEEIEWTYAAAAAA